MQHSLFWIIASLMEQGGYRKDQISNKNKHIIICWLFTAFLFRNLYTNDLYSNLTKKPVVKNLPNSFKELIANSSFPTLSIQGDESSYLIGLYISGESSIEQKTHFRTIFLWLNKTVHWLNYESESNSLIKFVDGQPGADTYRGLMWEYHQDVGVFPTWDRFTLLYEVNSVKDKSAAYLKPFFKHMEE